MEENTTNQAEINNITKEICNVSITAGINTNISKKYTNNTNPPKNTKKDKPWFDNECRIKRKHFLQIKRRLLRRKSKSIVDTKVLNHKAKIYK